MNITQAVIDRYRVELATTMDRTQFETFVNDESQRLEQRAAQLHPNQRATIDQLWRDRHPGQTMTEQDRIDNDHQARRAAVEIALAELWEGYSPEPHNPTEVSGTSSAMDRWLTDDAVQATPEIQELAEKVWPEETAQFQVWAEELLQARAEDGLRLPQSPQDQPLVSELSAVVHQALLDQERLDARGADVQR